MLRWYPHSERVKILSRALQLKEENNLPYIITMKRFGLSSYDFWNLIRYFRLLKRKDKQVKALLVKYEELGKANGRKIKSYKEFSPKKT